MNFKRSTWFMLCMASLICIPITFHFFPIAFPILSLNITMNRTQALERAREIAEQHDLVPKVFDQTAIFHLDENAKTFIELDGGGKDALTAIMRDDLYMPYVWAVRHFKEGDPQETFIFFKPDGTPYGFEQHFSENDPGLALSADHARDIAQQAAHDFWHIDLNLYTPIEAAQKTQPSGRVDHVFVYERPNLTIGSGGKYRLQLGVNGDQFSTLTHGIYIPETFTRRYTEMRSANETIAKAADLWYKLFYVVCGCILALLWLMRKRWLVVRTPLLWAIAIGILLALSKLNQLPIIWIAYKTEVPAQDFLLSYLMSILNELVCKIIPLLALGFIAAESLSRKAFGNQPQLWHVWSLPNAASYAIAGSTLGAYLLVSFDFALASIFYAFTLTYCHWWIPSSQFFDPNILATYFPWLQPCVESLFAGFHEECLFRAIPLAGAALIGDRIGKRNLMITLAFIMQAIVFSAAHANYPGMPAYARLVELIIPSCIYGLIYLRFGLLPVIISHTVYDIAWMALPLFISHAPYAWVNQLITIAIALIPAAIVLNARIRNEAWTVLAATQYNNAWQPPAPLLSLPSPSTHAPIPYVLSPFLRNGLILAGVIGIPLWLYTTKFDNDALPLYTQRQDALAYAKEYAQQHGMTSDDWYPIITVQNINDNTDQQHRFVWQQIDSATYKSLLTHYLISPRWFVRFVHFDKNLIERAEEYRVCVQDTDLIHGFYHVLPEPTPGASLTQAEARAQIDTIVAQETSIDPATLIEMEATSAKLPARTDWCFVLADPENYPLNQGQGRMLIQLAGDIFSRLSWCVQVPEAWERNDHSHLMQSNIVQTCCSLLFYLLTLLAACAIAYTSRFPLTLGIWRIIFGFVLFLEMLLLLLSWDELIVNISTSEPFYHQLFGILGSKMIHVLLHAGLLSTLMLVITNIHYRYTLPRSTHHDLNALGLGALIAGLLSYMKWFKPSLVPFWAHYEALNSLAPTTSVMSHAFVEFFIIVTALGILYALIDYVTNTGNRNHALGALSALLFTLCVTAQEPIFSFSYWLFSSIALSILIIAAYYLLLRFHRALLPLVTLPLIFGSYLQQAVLNAFTDSISINLLAATYCIFIAFIWSYAFTVNTEQSQNE